MTFLIFKPHSPKLLRPKIQRFVLTFFLLFLLLLGNSACHYDDTPPDDDKLYSIQPRVALQGWGLPAHKPILIRAWDNSHSYVWPLSDNFVTDISGSLRMSLAFDRYSDNAQIWLLIDDNQNGSIDTGDRYYTRDSITLPPYKKTLEKRIKNISFADADLLNSWSEISAAASQDAALPDGVYHCLLRPPGTPGWSPESPDHQVEIGKKTQKRPLTAWQPQIIFTWDGSSTTTSQTGVLPTGTDYSATCIHDANKNGYWDKGEDIYSLTDIPSSTDVDIIP